MRLKILNCISPRPTTPVLSQSYFWSKIENGVEEIRQDLQCVPTKQDGQNKGSQSLVTVTRQTWSIVFIDFINGFPKVYGLE